MNFRYLKHYDEIDFNDSEEKSKFSEKYIKLTNAIKTMVTLKNYSRFIMNRLMSII